MKHSLVLIDRGPQHVHRWVPSCSCGTWTGVQRRRKVEAVEQYRQHRSGAESRGTARFKPRPPTPADRLPLDLAPRVVTFS